MHSGQIHWSVFLLGTVCFLLGILIAVLSPWIGTLFFLSGLLFFLSGFLTLLKALIRKLTTELAVTDQRVIIKVGLIWRRTMEMNLAKVENIQIDQGILGRLLAYGTVTVVGTGGTREPFRHVADPLAFRKAVQSQSY